MVLVSPAMLFNRQSKIQKTQLEEIRTEGILRQTKHRLTIIYKSANNPFNVEPLLAPNKNKLRLH